MRLQFSSIKWYLKGSSVEPALICWSLSVSFDMMEVWVHQHVPILCVPYGKWQRSQHCCRTASPLRKQMVYIHLHTINRAAEVTWTVHTQHAVMALLIWQPSVEQRPLASFTIEWLLMKLNIFVRALISAEHVNTETQEKRFLAALQLCAGIRFNKCRIKSSVRASERRPPSQANAVTTLASQSLNVCKYCNKQQGFPHKRCSSSTGTDRRYGPWLQDKERCLPLSSPVFRWFSKEISNLRRQQGRALLEVSVDTPNSPGFYSVSASFPLIPARESLSDGLISCSNATFIMARSILCFHHVGSVVFHDLCGICLLLIGA